MATHRRSNRSVAGRVRIQSYRFSITGIPCCRMLESQTGLRAKSRMFFGVNRKGTEKSLRKSRSRFPLTGKSTVITPAVETFPAGYGCSLNFCGSDFTPTWGGKSAWRAKRGGTERPLQGSVVGVAPRPSSIRPFKRCRRRRTNQMFRGKGRAVRACAESVCRPR